MKFKMILVIMIVVAIASFAGILRGLDHSGYAVFDVTSKRFVEVTGQDAVLEIGHEYDITQTAEDPTDAEMREVAAPGFSKLGEFTSDNPDLTGFTYLPKKAGKCSLILSFALKGGGTKEYGLRITVKK